MQTQNIHEYEAIREELLNIKNCMTTYMSFILGGSGIAFFGLGAVSNESYHLIILSYTPFTMSIIITLVLLILFYKFNSHNRLAGYSKLLNHERFSSVNENISDLISWEICMDRMRAADFSNEPLIQSCTTIKVQGVDQSKLQDIVKNISGKKAPTEKNRYTKGFTLFKNAILGNIQTKSWAFPIYVVLVFFPLSMFFFTVGVYFTFCVFKSGDYNLITKLFLGAATLVVILYKFRIWQVFLGKLYSLLTGGATVDAYCCKFLPIRAEFLNDNRITPEYLIAELVPSERKK